MGASGLLHRMDVQKAAVHFLQDGDMLPPPSPNLSLNHTMVEDEDLRKAEKILSHLATLSKSYGEIKAKKGRDLLLEKTLQGRMACMGSVRSFHEGQASDENH